MERLHVSNETIDGVTAYLSGDHRRIDEVISDVRRMIEDGETERAEHTFQEVDEQLRRHIRIEDEIVFPVFEARTGCRGPTTVLRQEHRQIEEVLVAIAGALARGELRGARDQAFALAMLLGNHNMKEERILYPRTDQALRDEERVELVARLRAG